MRVLITSGGTTEKIDEVRGISNFATGRLGTQIAETFLAAGHHVIMLAGYGAILPKATKNLTLIFISDVAHLMQRLKEWLPQVDLVIHSMAVSDYHPLYMTGLSNLPDSLSTDQLIHFSPESDKKISSNDDYQIMLLEKTPKVIRFIKKWNPAVLLFGFKLLVGVSEEKLIRTAKESLDRNHADFILANDLEMISDTQHHAFLISQNQQIRLKTREEIANEILKQSVLILSPKGDLNG